MTRSRLLVAGAAAAALTAAAALGFGLAKLGASPSTPAEAAPTTAERAPDALSMTEEAARAAGVVVEALAPGGLAAEVTAQGTATSPPDGAAILTARSAGAVVRIGKRLGDPVRAGEVLAIIESRDAAQIAADRSAASARATLAQRNLARERRLFEQRISPRMDLEQAEAEAAAAGAEARRAAAAAAVAGVTASGRGVAVTSPIAGRVTAAAASLGAYVQPDTELFRVADPRLIQIEAALSAADAPRVAPGDLAVVETADGRLVETRVRSLTPAFDAQTRAATALLDAPGEALRPGQAVRVRIRTKAAASARLTAPEEAIQTVRGRDVAFVRTPEGFRVRPVTLGARSAGRVEIVSGLAPGQAIAVRNAFLLKAELGKGEEN